ncbi:MAG: TIR domain-containing protein [Clostridiales bacterium]|nr:TIR domain-containing protein [Clostridiales bacterium]
MTGEKKTDVFISHHMQSSHHIVECIANKLEGMGIRCWYAPRDTEGTYAGSIVKAINSCSVFLLVLNKEASEAMHVLNEIDTVCSRFAEKKDVKIIPFHIADEDIGDELKYYIGRMHWIDAMNPPIYRRIDELTERIAALFGSEEKAPALSHTDRASKYRLVERRVQPREVFEGREELLKDIDSAFENGKKAVFLEGIGGIGKSEAAKQYSVSKEYGSNYDLVLYLTYQSSLKDLICSSSVLIENFTPKAPNESDDKFFERKLEALQCLLNERVLMIIDNFDVDGDESLDRLLESGCRFIFTTRNSHKGCFSIPVEEIKNFDILLDIFEKNCGEKVSEDDYGYLKEIFEIIEYHTYTVELIAKQMEASFLSPEEMLEILKKGQAQSLLTETVEGRNKMNTAFGHICSVFNLSGLSWEEKNILRCLSLMGVGGVSALRFRQWMGFDSFEPFNRLIRKSWMRRDTGRRLFLHPLVSEVVRAVLAPDMKNTYEFQKRMAAFAYDAWLRPYNENLETADNFLSVTEFFSKPDASYLQILECYEGFLWQVGKFDAAVSFGHKLYNSCVEQFGEDSFEAGYAAKALGGSYFNSRRLKESVPWYNQGLKSMLACGIEANEDLAMSYEKAARCCTWEYDRDFEKAQLYFNKALEIRKKCDEILKNENKRVCYAEFQKTDENFAKIRIGETYMEMGRMYQLMGDYEKALECSSEFGKLISLYDPGNVSGIAYSLYDKGVSYYHLGLKAKKEGDSVKARELFELAEENLKKDLESNTKMRGSIAVDTIDNWEMLGDLYSAAGRQGEAADAYMAVITMTEELFGEDDLKIKEIKEKLRFDN